MTRKECVDGMQRIIDEDRNKILVRVHVGYLIHAVKYLKDQPEIVRCKDCKHRPTDPENKGVGQSLVFPDEICPCQVDDHWYSWMPKDDWFCAGGERRDDDGK